MANLSAVVLLLPLSLEGFYKPNHINMSAGIGTTDIKYRTILSSSDRLTHADSSADNSYTDFEFKSFAIPPTR